MSFSAEEELKCAMIVNFMNFAFESFASREWASITFSGHRHRIVLRIDGDKAADEAARFLDGLGDREFDLQGHLLADIALVSEERSADAVRLTLEALTIEES